MRPYLVFMSTGAAGPESNLFEDRREYDVALHSYAPVGAVRMLEAEYCWTRIGEKLNVAAALLPGIFEKYSQIAILDDDLTFTADQINRLFQTGQALGLPLYQPALTAGSYYSHGFLLQQYGSPPVRHVPFVEIMCPFFSRNALADCLPTFDINESGWGLDCYLWPRAVAGGTFVIDSIPVGHYREPARRQRILKNGLTPMQELWIQQVIDDPATARF